MSGQTLSNNLEPFITDRVVTLRIVTTEEDWASCQANVLAEEYIKADFWFDGELVPDVAIRPKGNSSLRSAADSGTPRFSLKIDFNFFNVARTFRGLKKLNLNNGFSDPTLIRECLAYELFEQMGIPTPRTSFVDLWVNDTHLGVYTTVEQVDKTFLGRYFIDATGNLYKPEAYAASLNWTEADLEEQRAKLETSEQNNLDSSLDINLGGGKLREIMQALEPRETVNDTETSITVPNVPRGMMPPGGQPPPPGGQPPPPGGQPPPPGGWPPPPGGEPPPGGMPGNQSRSLIELMGLKTNENCPDYSALLHFLDILNNEPDETFPVEIEKVLDVDGALRFLAVSALIVHLDNYIGLGHNYYLYEINGKFTILPWDLNMAFGTFNGFGAVDREGIMNFYIDEPTVGPLAERPLVQRLLSHQPYLNAYHGYLEALLDGPFSVEVMESRIDQLADLIRPFVQADKLKFYSTDDFERCLSEDVGHVEVRGSTPVGQEPIVTPALSPETLACLKKQLGMVILEEFITRRPTPQELKKLKICLTREELAVLPRLLQDAFRTAGQQRQPMKQRSGLTAIGLKTFVIERTASVKQQLDGEQPSAGDGSGNGDNTNTRIREIEKID